MKTAKTKKLSALLLSAAITAGLLTPVNAQASESGYVLMNIPYEAFYGAENVSVKVSDSSKLNINYDAISSATNKVGNYGKSGGAYHSKKSAQIAEDGTVTAVGGENGATNEGVIWPVKVENMSELSTLGGNEITDSSEVTVATLGRRQTSSTDLKGYQTLTEAPEYSYYVLSDAPEYYMELSVENNKPVFTANSGTATTQSEIAPAVTYGSNWGDVQLNLTDAEDVSDKQINAVVITAKDKDNNTITAGLIHLYNVWSYSDMAWRNSQIEGLNGATITNIRYYCNNKAEDSSELTHYVYDYPMNLKLLQAYDGEVTAKFNGNTAISLTGLPTDIEGLKAQVYHSTGGRNPVLTYLTPLVVDSADDDIDPVTVEVEDGIIPIVSGEVKNNAGTTATYGNPVSGTTYTIALSSDNYAPFTAQVTYVDISNNSIEIENVENNNGLSVTAKLSSDGEITGTAIAAVYNEHGAILAVKSDKAANEVTFSFDELTDAKTVKVMWWDSFNGMTPQAIAAESEMESTSSYVLMNIPYEEFYGAENVSAKISDNSKLNINYDAISSATNKVGNYGKSGGAYHSKKSAEIADDGTVIAVGGANGATNEGVIWPVKVKNTTDLSALGGNEITDSSKVTIATLGRGQTSSTDLTGYQTLTEAPEYSYYVLNEAPEYYMELSIDNNKPVFTANNGTATTQSEIAPAVTYGSNWGDVQLNLADAADVSDKQINAVVITATDKDNNTITAGLIHLYNVWSYSDMAWRTSQIEGLNGATITNIRYYCNNKAENSSELIHYIYDYPMNLKLLPAYDGEVTAEFEGSTAIVLNSLPTDIEGLKAQVYYSTGGRNPVLTYLTPLAVDPADDDIDPVTVDVGNGIIPIVSGEVTNNAGTTESYGNPVSGTTYTIA